MDEGYYLRQETAKREVPAYSSESQQLRVFLAHSGESQAFYRLERFLRDLGVTPSVVEWLPYEGGTVPTNVQRGMEGCACAIVFYEGQGKGMLIELGQLQKVFKDRIIYLVEEGQSFGPMADAFARESFTRDNLEEAFHRIVIELRNWGYLQVTKASMN